MNMGNGFITIHWGLHQHKKQWKQNKGVCILGAIQYIWVMNACRHFRWQSPLAEANDLNNSTIVLVIIGSGNSLLLIGRQAIAWIIGDLQILDNNS